MGTAYADHSDAPRIGYLRAGFGMFAGEPLREYVEAKVEGAICAPAGEWVQLFREIKGADLHIYPRVDFAAAPADRDQVQALAQSLADGFSIHRVTEADIGQFAELADSLGGL